jgi:hypothetical protein
MFVNAPLKPLNRLGVVPAWYLTRRPQMRKSMICVAILSGGLFASSAVLADDAGRQRDHLSRAGVPAPVPDDRYDPAMSRHLYAQAGERKAVVAAIAASPLISKSVIAGLAKYPQDLARTDRHETSYLARSR